MKKKYIIFCTICVFLVVFIVIWINHMLVFNSNGNRISNTEQIPKEVNSQIVDSKTTLPSTSDNLKDVDENIEAKRWPLPPMSPVLKEKNGMTKMINIESRETKRFLIENPIKIEEQSVSQSNEGIKIELKFPQIKGLLNQSVQEKINNDIKGYADKLIKCSNTYRKDLKEVRLSYYISANYNNVLCLNLYQYISLIDDSFFIPETLLFELVSGNRLELKDVFNSDSYFPDLLNRSIEEYLLKNNLEEQILKAPFKGLREGQGFQLTESRLIILVDKNEEITFNGMVYGPNNFIFRFTQFNGLIDIYDKFATPGSKIYESDEKKKKMLPNDIDVKYLSIWNQRETYSAEVHGVMFSRLKNIELEKKLNELCSYSAEAEFREQLPKDLKKSDKSQDVPQIRREYYVKADYSDVICIEAREYYSIPGVKVNNSMWHMTFNLITGKKLALKDLFRINFNWIQSVESFIKEDSQKRNIDVEKSDITSAIQNSDFWFDEEQLWINLKPDTFIDNERKNENVYSIPFEYLKEENLVIR